MIQYPLTHHLRWCWWHDNSLALDVYSMDPHLLLVELEFKLTCANGDTDHFEPAEVCVSSVPTCFLVSQYPHSVCLSTCVGFGGLVGCQSDEERLSFFVVAGGRMKVDEG